MLTPYTAGWSSARQRQATTTLHPRPLSRRKRGTRDSVRLSLLPVLFTAVPHTANIAYDMYSVVVLILDNTLKVSLFLRHHYCSPKVPIPTPPTSQC